jgi:hypothetical protein
VVWDITAKRLNAQKIYTLGTVVFLIVTAPVRVVLEIFQIENALLLKQIVRMGRIA